MREAKLVAARMLSPEVRELTIDPGADFRFVAGQWVSFRIPVQGQIAARAYSIASAPRADGPFQIAVTRVEQGLGSGYLHALELPAVLPMTGPEGLFRLEEPQRPILMVATGTGVSPLRSMLLAAESAGRELPPTTLLFGMRTESDLLYREDFERLASKWRAFRYEPTLSRAGEAWSGRRGYAQAHVAELVRALGGDCDVYACGLNEMIKEVRGLLKSELGFARQRIHTERYD